MPPSNDDASPAIHAPDVTPAQAVLAHVKAARDAISAAAATALAASNANDPAAAALVKAAALDLIALSAHAVARVPALARVIGAADPVAVERGAINVCDELDRLAAAARVHPRLMRHDARDKDPHAVDPVTLAPVADPTRKAAQAAPANGPAKVNER